MLGSSGHCLDLGRLLGSSPVEHLAHARGPPLAARSRGHALGGELVTDSLKCQARRPKLAGPADRVRGHRHRTTAPAHAVADLGRELGHSGAGALPDAPSLHLGERGRHLGHRPARDGGGIDSEVEADDVPVLALGIVEDAGEVRHGAAEAVELAHGQHVSLACLQVCERLGQDGPTLQGLGGRGVLSAQVQLPTSGLGLPGEFPDLDLGANVLLVGADADVANDAAGVLMLQIFTNGVPPSSQRVPVRLPPGGGGWDSVMTLKLR